MAADDTVITEEIKRLSKEFRDLAPDKIVLMGKKFPGQNMSFVAQQVKGRKRIQKKLPSWFENESIAFPMSLSLEQCSSERAARYKAGLIPNAETGVDLTGGFGVDARFMAEKFGRFHYVERDGTLANLVAWNFRQFGLADKVQVNVGDGIEWLDTIEEKLDFAFVDPVRRDSRALRISALEDCEPNLVDAWDRLRAKASLVMVKASPGLDISHALELLEGVTEAHVVSVENDCKELLLLAGGGNECDIRIHCVNILKSGEISKFSFGRQEEIDADPIVGIPKEYLYEPNASIMKAGAFKSICSAYGVRALNPRTRLYCSDRLVENFPGRVFKILGRGAMTAADARKLFPEKKVNVISRNSGLSVDELRKKLKLKEGGKRFAIGATVSDVGRQLFACELVRNAN